MAILFPALKNHNAKVDALGGPSQIASLLKTSATSGINSDDTADIAKRQEGNWALLPKSTCFMSRTIGHQFLH